MGGEEEAVREVNHGTRYAYAAAAAAKNLPEPRHHSVIVDAVISSIAPSGEVCRPPSRVCPADQYRDFQPVNFINPDAKLQTKNCNAAPSAVTETEGQQLAEVFIAENGILY